jgi:hypothetical protein
VKRFPGKHARFFLVALSMRLLAAPAMNSPQRSEAEAQRSASVSEESAVSEPKNPRPVKPSREARTRGSELSLLIGFSVMPSASYAYDTRVSLPGVTPLRYSGRRRSLALGPFAGGAFTLPGSLRRITLGAGVNPGGPDLRYRVIPDGASTPFSKQSLYSDIQIRYSFRPGWGAAFSPFIEHDIGFFHGSRVRAGYQYWDQVGAYTGSFVSADGRSMINYNVRLNLRSHFFCISMNDYVASQDDTGTPQRSKRQSGLIQRWGITIGAHQTIVVFAAIGHFWQLAP